VKLSQPKEQKYSEATAVVSVSEARVLAERPTVTAKPKVVRENPPETAKGALILKSQTSNFKQITNNNFQLSNEEYSTVAPINGGTPEKTGMPATQAEFFGSTAEGGRICYVVDCSGSMQGLWGQVKEELCESIGRLEPDQYFSVIVFGAGSIMESGGGRLVRASERAKKEAYEFIGAVQPRGVTNAPAAIEHAIKIRDGSGAGPSVIYFLTDGFELSEQGNIRFGHQVETMLKNYSPETRINTIGFLAGEQDSLLLEAIANKSGGRFTLIRGTGEKQ